MTKKVCGLWSSDFLLNKFSVWRTFAIGPAHRILMRFLTHGLNDCVLTHIWSPYWYLINESMMNTMRDRVDISDQRQSDRSGHFVHFSPYLSLCCALWADDRNPDTLFHLKKYTYLDFSYRVTDYTITFISTYMQNKCCYKQYIDW